MQLSKGWHGRERRYSPHVLQSRVFLLTSASIKGEEEGRGEEEGEPSPLPLHSTSLLAFHFPDVKFPAFKALCLEVESRTSE